jgi:hypothetical protein
MSRLFFAIFNLTHSDFNSESAIDLKDSNKSDSKSFLNDSICLYIINKKINILHILESEFYTFAELEDLKTAFIKYIAHIYNNSELQICILSLNIDSNIDSQFKQIYNKKFNL